MITEDRIKEIISKSGYLKEQQVIIEFQKHSFFAGANYAFEDQDEHKSREVDFIATKYKDLEFGKSGFYFFAYGEVKQRSNPLIFFERNRLPQDQQEIFIPIVATREYFSNIEPLLDIRKILKFANIHHQIKHNFISTQFCEIVKNKAKHSDLYESLFVPLLKCIDSEITYHNKGIGIFDPKNPKYFLMVFHPIIIVSGPLYSYNVNNDKLEQKSYLLYRRHYISKTIKRTLLFDIVANDDLSTYITSKLLKTYEAIELAFKKRIEKVIKYCYKDWIVWHKKINKIQKRHGFQTTTEQP